MNKMKSQKILTQAHAKCAKKKKKKKWNARKNFFTGMKDFIRLQKKIDSTDFSQLWVTNSMENEGMASWVTSDFV